MMMGLIITTTSAPNPQFLPFMLPGTEFHRALLLVEREGIDVDGAVAGDDLGSCPVDLALIGDHHDLIFHEILVLVGGAIFKKNPTTTTFKLESEMTKYFKYLCSRSFS